MWASWTSHVAVCFSYTIVQAVSMEKSERYPLHLSVGSESWMLRWPPNRIDRTLAYWSSKRKEPRSWRPLMATQKSVDWSPWFHYDADGLICLYAWFSLLSEASMEKPLKMVPPCSWQNVVCSVRRCSELKHRWIFSPLFLRSRNVRS